MDTSRSLNDSPDAIAPDTMEVRLLARCSQGSMAHFRLAGNRSGAAVVHADLEEVWYCVSGVGMMWLSRDHDLAEPPMSVRPGTSFVIPAGAAFQLRNVASDPIDFIGVTMPPWPGDEAAHVVSGPFD